MGLISLVKRIKHVFSGSGLGPYNDFWGYGLRTLPGTQYDYRAEAGLLWENSIVAACLRWTCDTWSEAPLCVRRRGENNKMFVDYEHQINRFLSKPCAYYDEPTLWAGTILSLKIGGEAYWVKVRSAAGKMIGVVYVPHYLISPRWRNDNFIDYYEYKPDGKSIKYPVEDVVHLRMGLDPTNQRRGINYLNAVLREVCTENEAATFSATILRNFGVPSAIVSPKEKMDELSAQQRELFKQRWQEEIAGDNVGGVFVQSIPVDIATPGMSPEQLVLDKIRDIPVSRICGVWGIDPMVVGLPSSSKTYSNYKEAHAAAYKSCLLPLHRRIGPQLDAQILAEFESDTYNYKLGWDYTDVKAMQDAREDLFKMLVNSCGGPFLTPNEARLLADYAPVPDGDELRKTPSENNNVKPTVDINNLEASAKDFLKRALNGA